MITQIKGKLLEKHPTHVVIECNGIGYMVHISLYTYGQLGDEELLKLYTHLQVKEDSHTLFGFYQNIERSIFRLLISISGIGASTARTMLSSLTPGEIQSAIVSGNVSVIQSVKGIGLKTAQRVIIDLKDKVSLISENNQFIGNISNTNQDEALSALEVLGYNRKQTSKLIEMLVNNSPEMSVEELIKGALNKL